MLARKCTSVATLTGKAAATQCFMNTSISNCTPSISKGTSSNCRMLPVLVSSKNSSTLVSPLMGDDGRKGEEMFAKKNIIKATNAPVVHAGGSGASAYTTSSDDCSNNVVNHHKNNPIRDFSTAATGNTSFDEPNNSESSSSTTENSANNPLKEMEEIVNNSNSGTSFEELKELAMKPCTPLSLGDMYKYASANVNSKNYAPQRLRNAQFLYQEIPIRIAQRAVDLLTLPYGLNKTQSVQSIANIYLRYLTKLRNFPCPTNDEEELEFTNLLRTLVLDRSSIPEAIANGVFALKDHRTEGLDLQRLQAMEKALYRFFNARTGLRLVTEHHVLSCMDFREENVELRKSQSCLLDEHHDNEREDFLGCIQKNCDPTTEAKIVAAQIMDQCKRRYGVTPEIEIIDCTPDQFKGSDFTFVPHHLQYMLAELLKNSCRATVKRCVFVFV